MGVSQFVQQKAEKYGLTIEKHDPSVATAYVLYFFLKDVLDLLRTQMRDIKPDLMDTIIKDVGSFLNEIDAFSPQDMESLVKKGHVDSVDGLRTSLDNLTIRLSELADWHAAKNKAVDTLKSGPLKDYYKFMENCRNTLQAALKHLSIKNV